MSLADKFKSKNTSKDTDDNTTDVYEVNWGLSTGTTRNPDDFKGSMGTSYNAAHNKRQQMIERRNNMRKSAYKG